MKIVAIALLSVAVATPAFAQFQQLRQLGTAPNPHSIAADPYRNDGNNAQPSQRPLNANPADNYNTFGTSSPNRSIYLTTPNPSRY